MELQKPCLVTSPKEMLDPVLKQELESVVLASSLTIVIVAVSEHFSHEQLCRSLHSSASSFPALAILAIFRRIMILHLHSRSFDYPKEHKVSGLRLRRGYIRVLMATIHCSCKLRSLRVTTRSKWNALELHQRNRWTIRLT